MTVTILGVDACKAGWVGIALDRGMATAYFAATIAELVSAAETTGDLAVVAIGIPIGLPDNGPRRADLLAREAVGPRRRSVFMTPVRAALHSDTHAAAVRQNRERAGKGISIQAFGLRTKILDVDAWVREQRRRVVEVHPELSFNRMSGAPLPHPKTTWAGIAQRRSLLAAAGIRLADNLGPAGHVAQVDDVLDATAAAWTARRVAAGDASSLPSPPETYSDGLPCAIWA